MRLLAFIVAVSCLACNMDGLPNGVGGGGPGPNNSADGGGGDGGHLVDLAVSPDLAKPLGGEGAMCASACDCQAGLACFQKLCTVSMLGSVYCCESMNCPSGMFCQSGTDGSFKRCGMSGGGGGGGGGSAQCGFIPCQSNATCMQAGCASCNKMTNRCQ
jgi:hypothetical protein